MKCLPDMSYHGKTCEEMGLGCSVFSLSTELSFCIMGDFGIGISNSWLLNNKNRRKVNSNNILNLIYRCIYRFIIESFNSFSYIQGEYWLSLQCSQSVEVALLSINHLCPGAVSSGWIQLDQVAYIGPPASLLVLTHLPFAALWGR